MKKLLLLSFILSVFNIGKSDFDDGLFESFGVFHPLIEEISGYKDTLTHLNNPQVIAKFDKLINQIKEFARFHEQLIPEYYTVDSKKPFAEFDSLFKSLLREEIIRINFYSTEGADLPNSQDMLNESLKIIEDLFDKVTEKLLSFNVEPKSLDQTSFDSATIHTPTHLYVLIRFCIKKEALSKFIPESMRLESYFLDTLNFFKHFLELDPNIFNGNQFNTYYKSLKLYENQYDKKLLDAFSYARKI